jgi:hypothetical protein
LVDESQTSSQPYKGNNHNTDVEDDLVDVYNKRVEDDKKLQSTQKCVTTLSHIHTIDKDSNYEEHGQRIIQTSLARPSQSPPIHQHKLDEASRNIVACNAGHIRRLYEGSDIRVCEDCGRKGDRWDIEMHLCKKYNVVVSESERGKKIEWP